MANPSDSKLPGLKGFDTYDIRPWMIAVVASMTVMAFLSVVLRMYSRHLNGQKLWWDDWMIVFSLGWYFLVVGFIFAMQNSGMGLHADVVGDANIVSMARWLVVAEILYTFALVWTKISLLQMYYRIFHVPYFKKMAWIVGALVIALAVCVMFLFIFVCVPVDTPWASEAPGHCINPGVNTWIANAACAIVTDLIILALPLPQIWGLQLRKRQKIGLTCSFGLGLFVVFASAYRTSVLFTYSPLDPTYTLAPTVGWTVIEMSAGITSACLPTLLPVLNAIALACGLRTPGGTQNSRSGDKSGDQSNLCANNRSANLSAIDRKSKADAFYRLSDDNISDDPIREGLNTPLESKLRPDTKMGYQFTVHSTAKTDEESGDDIPLRGIRVKQAFESTKEQI